MPLLTLVALWLALLAAPALAADPIMPLSQVQRGMQCEGRSVFRGTAIESFDVEILDVIAPGPDGGAAILFRASGPAVGESGLGPGFSGSPIYCRDSEGVARNAGAVSAGIEDYGNDVALATPIEDILGMPVATPSQARTATAAERRARPWALPLTVSGPGGPVRRALLTAARSRGLQLLVAPATAAQVDTGTDLQPGSAVGVAISTGSMGLGAFGTVAYRDGDRIWAFGHPLDDAGPRSLFLQGAFVHAVIGNPNPPGFDGLGTYKLASPGTTAGQVGFDGLFAVTGTLGRAPAGIPLRVVARDAGGGRLPVSDTLVADEAALNHPGGLPALSLLTSIAVGDRAFAALGSGSGRSYGTLCMRVELRGRDRPMRFCNRYVGDGQIPGGTQTAMGADAAFAASLVEQYDRALLHVERVRVSLQLADGLRFAKIRRATAGRRRVRPGRSVRIRLAVQPPREPVRHVSFRLRIPRSLKPGVRTLRLTGAAPDPGEGSLVGVFGFALASGGGLSETASPSGAARAARRTPIERLARSIRRVHRYDGVRGTFRKQREPGANEVPSLAELFGFGGADTSGGKKLFRHPRLRIGGSAKVRFRVLPPRASMPAS
jgi:hypothetical protein